MIGKVKRTLEYLNFLRTIKKSIDPTFDSHPFFILSAGRSGSTLLRKLLMQNFYIHIPPESSTIVPGAIKWFSRSESHLEDSSIKEFVRSISRGDFRYWNISSTEMEEMIIKDSSIQGINKLIYSIYDFHRIKFNPSGSLVGDKTPYLTFYIKYLKIIYPKSKYIFLVRNPYSVISSRMKNFNEPLKLATNRWLWSAKEMEKHSDIDHIFIRYEDLVEKSSDILEKIGFFLNAKVRNERIEIDDSVFGDINLSHHKMSNSSIVRTSDDKHKEMLTQNEIQFIRKKCSKYLDDFG